MINPATATMLDVAKLAREALEKATEHIHANGVPAARTCTSFIREELEAFICREIWQHAQDMKELADREALAEHDNMLTEEDRRG